MTDSYSSTTVTENNHALDEFQPILFSRENSDCCERLFDGDKCHDQLGADSAESKLTFIFRALFDKCLTKKQQQLETKQPLEQQQQQKQQTNVYCNDNNLNNANLLLLSSSSSFSPSSSSNEIDASQTQPSTTTTTTTTARIIMNENDENANTCSLVKCADVIEYFSNDINNQEAVESLKDLFLEYFHTQKLKRQEKQPRQNSDGEEEDYTIDEQDDPNSGRSSSSSSRSSSVSEDDLGQIKLEFKTFNDILLKWISKFNIEPNGEMNYALADEHIVSLLSNNDDGSYDDESSANRPASAFSLTSSSMSMPGSTSPYARPARRNLSSLRKQQLKYLKTYDANSDMSSLMSSKTTTLKYDETRCFSSSSLGTMTTVSMITTKNSSSSSTSSTSTTTTTSSTSSLDSYQSITTAADNGERALATIKNNNNNITNKRVNENVDESQLDGDLSMTSILSTSHDEAAPSNRSVDVDYLKQLNAELEIENTQLKQTQTNLKRQLLNCEETNLQMVNDLDAQTKRLNDLERLNRDLNVRLANYVDDNNELRKLTDQLKLKLNELTNENAFLNTNLKDSLNKLDLCEPQLTALNQQSLADKQEIKKLFFDLSVEKEKSNIYKKLNENYENQIQEMSIKFEQQNQIIERLNNSLKESKLENENLTDNISKLETQLENAEMRRLQEEPKNARPKRTKKHENNMNNNFCSIHFMNYNNNNELNEYDYDGKNDDHTGNLNQPDENDQNHRNGFIELELKFSQAKNSNSSFSTSASSLRHKSNKNEKNFLHEQCENEMNSLKKIRNLIKNNTSIKQLTSRKNFNIHQQLETAFKVFSSSSSSLNDCQTQSNNNNNNNNNNKSELFLVLITELETIINYVRDYLTLLEKIKLEYVCLNVNDCLRDSNNNNSNCNKNNNTIKSDVLAAVAAAADDDDDKDINDEHNQYDETHDFDDDEDATTADADTDEDYVDDYEDDDDDDVNNQDRDENVDDRNVDNGNARSRVAGKRAKVAGIVGGGEAKCNKQTHIRKRTNNSFYLINAYLKTITQNVFYHLLNDINNNLNNKYNKICDKQNNNNTNENTNNTESSSNNNNSLTSQLNDFSVKSNETSSQNNEQNADDERENDSTSDCVSKPSLNELAMNFSINLKQLNNNTKSRKPNNQNEPPPQPIATEHPAPLQTNSNSKFSYKAKVLSKLTPTLQQSATKNPDLIVWSNKQNKITTHLQQQATNKITDFSTLSEKPNNNNNNCNNYYNNNCSSSCSGNSGSSVGCSGSTNNANNENLNVSTDLKLVPTVENTTNNNNNNNSIKKPCTSSGCLVSSGGGDRSFSSGSVVSNSGSSSNVPSASNGADCRRENDNDDDDERAAEFNEKNVLVGNEQTQSSEIKYSLKEHVEKVEEEKNKEKNSIKSKQQQQQQRQKNKKSANRKNNSRAQNEEGEEAKHNIIIGISQEKEEDIINKRFKKMDVSNQLIIPSSSSGDFINSISVEHSKPKSKCNVDSNEKSREMNEKNTVNSDASNSTSKTGLVKSNQMDTKQQQQHEYRFRNIKTLGSSLLSNSLTIKNNNQRRGEEDKTSHHVNNNCTTNSTTTSNTSKINQNINNNTIKNSQSSLLDSLKSSKNLIKTSTNLDEDRLENVKIIKNNCKKFQYHIQQHQQEQQQQDLPMIKEKHHQVNKLVPSLSQSSSSSTSSAFSTSSSCSPSTSCSSTSASGASPRLATVVILNSSRLHKTYSLPCISSTTSVSLLPSRDACTQTEPFVNETQLDSSTTSSSSSSSYNYDYGGNTQNEDQETGNNESDSKKQEAARHSTTIRSDLAPLRHQLTRDSGIDSDNHHQHRLRPDRFKPRQLVRIVDSSQCHAMMNSVDEEEPTNGSENEASKTNAHNKMSSSTRENSMDQEPEYMPTSAGASLSIDDADCCLNFDDDFNLDALVNSNVDTAANSSRYVNSFDAASNRRQLFRNSSNKHHTIAVSGSSMGSMNQARPRQISLDKKFDLDDSSMRLFNSRGERDSNLKLIQTDFDRYNKHLETIQSTKPTVGFTSLSKLASNLKQAENENLKQATNLSIDDILNTNSSSSNVTGVNAKFDSATSRLGVTRRVRPPFLSNRPNSICLSSSLSKDSVPASSSASFDDATNSHVHGATIASTGLSRTEEEPSACTDTDGFYYNEHRLKLLESNFNQISISHHTDQKLIDLCIDRYKEKFFKTDSYVSKLFDDMNQMLQKLVNCLNELNRMESEKYQQHQQRQHDHNQNGSLDTGDAAAGLYDDEYYLKSYNSILEMDESEQNQTNLLSINETLNNFSSGSTAIKANKKFLQENLNTLNKIANLVRKSMIDMVITSNMIGGLKQESHLSELVKISISYVKELKKSLNNSGAFTVTNSHILSQTSNLAGPTAPNSSYSLSSMANTSTGTFSSALTSNTKPYMKRSLTINQNANSIGSLSRAFNAENVRGKSTRNKPPFSASMSIEASTKDPTWEVSTNRHRSNTLNNCDPIDLESTDTNKKKKSSSLSSSSTINWFNSLNIIRLTRALNKTENPKSRTSISDTSVGSTGLNQNTDVDTDVRSLTPELERRLTRDDSTSESSDVHRQEFDSQLAADDLTSSEHLSNDNTADLLTSHQSILHNTKGYLVKFKHGMYELPDLIKKDSFKYLRLTLSTLILAFSLLFFLLTFFQGEDLYENLFSLIKNYVFVSHNPNDDDSNV